jgi:hypothetical protein
MKTLIITIVSLALGAAFVHAQGLIEIAARPVGSVMTNTSSFYNQNAGTFSRGPIPTQPQAGAAYYFALLIASTTTAGDASPLGSDWSQAIVGAGTSFGTPGDFITASNSVNLVGGVSGTGGTVGVPVNGWVPGATMQMMLVGWSANLGPSWSQVSGELSSSIWNSAGYFGNSGIASILSGGYGLPATPPESIFGAAIQGFDMFAVVPEPSTLVLVGFGGLSMLFLRRRKV